MPFKFEVQGFDELQRKLQELGEKGQQIAAKGLYEGAGVMADKVSQSVRGIDTAPFRYAKDGTQRKPSPEEKAILLAARTGVAKFRKDGNSLQTSVGMQNSGYAKLGNVTKPIPQIANAINSGTSFMAKQPFFRKAVSQGKGPAETAIEESIRKQLEEEQL